MRRSAIACLAFAALLGGCGDDSGEDATTVTETVQSTVTGTATNATSTTTDAPGTTGSDVPAGGLNCSSQTEATGVTVEHPGYIAVRAVDADCEDALAVAQAWIEDWEFEDCEKGCVKDVNGFSCTYGRIPEKRSRAPEVECLAAHSVVSFSLSYYD